MCFFRISSSAEDHSDCSRLTLKPGDSMHNSCVLLKHTFVVYYLTVVLVYWPCLGLAGHSPVNMSLVSSQSKWIISWDILGVLNNVLLVHLCGTHYECLHGYCVF